MAEVYQKNDIIESADGTVVEMQQDYSPGYDIIQNSTGVIEGTRITSNANASTGRDNLVQFDLSSEEAANAINAKYPKAWTLMYPNTVWSYFDAEGNSNAYKLQQAVNLYLYLYNEETTNISLDEYEDNLEATNVLVIDTDRRPYSETMSEIYSSGRVPPTMWSREFTTNAEGKLVDMQGNVVEPIYVDADGNPLSHAQPVDIDTPGEKDLYTQMMRLAWALKQVPAGLEVFYNPDGTLVKPLTEFTAAELNTLRASNLFTYGFEERNRTFVPHTLAGSRIVGYKILGTPAANLISLEHQALTEYQTTLVGPKSMYDWGGPYATGKNTF